MKLRIKKFNIDYYHEDVGFASITNKTKKWIKSRLGRALRNEAKEEIRKEKEELTNIK